MAEFVYNQIRQAQEFEQRMPQKPTSQNNFLEQFEDSEQYNSQMAGSPGGLNPDDEGYPIQLVRIRPSGKIELEEKALQIICSCDLPVGFVSLIGKYRTGKSFLLNKLLFLQGKGFKVDPATSACTQGIWMWSKPVYNERLGNYLFFVDTEGSQSLTKDVENDTKIFVLATLISSYLMFNSVGSIDEKSINELNVVTKLSLNILVEQNLRTKQNQDVLYRFMPKFLWILRDFTLQLRDEYGKPILPKQYLESCLLDQNTLLKANQDSRKIRRAIASHFKDRDCITLVRPASEERDLQMLDQIPEHKLRKQFLEAINSLRERIMRQAGPKVYEGTPLYGSSVVSMLESYVDSINNNGFPTIKTAWENISEDEGAFAYNKALEVYNEIYQQEFSTDEPKGEEIHKILSKLRDDTITEFNRNLSQSNDIYYDKLKEFLTEKQEAILQVNKQLNDIKNIEVLKQCASNLMRKIQAKDYDGKPEQMSKDLEKTIQQYKSRAKGQNKGEILSEFLANISPLMLQIQKPPVDKQNEAIRNLEKQQYEKRIKLMEQQLKAVENQLKSTKEQNEMLVKIKNESMKPITKPDPKAKKQSMGCCGAGSCTIM